MNYYDREPPPPVETWKEPHGHHEMRGCQHNNGFCADMGCNFCAMEVCIFCVPCPIWLMAGLGVLILGCMPLFR